MCGSGKYIVYSYFSLLPTCEPCPANSWSPPDSNFCTCNVGYTGPPDACVSYSTGLAPGTASCPAGSYYLTGPNTIGCTFCEPGKYSSAQGTQTSCTQCQANSTSAAGSDRAEDCLCNAGFVLEGSAGEPQRHCVMCGSGKYIVYSYFLLLPMCEPCPANSWSPPDNNFCICNEGYKGPPDTCVSYPINQSNSTLSTIAAASKGAGDLSYLLSPSPTSPFLLGCLLLL